MMPMNTGEKNKSRDAADGGKGLDRKVLLFWLLVAVWAVAIFAVSAKSGAEFDGTGILAQAKRWIASVLSAVTGQSVDPSPIGHFFEYFVFGLLLFNATWRSFGSVRAESASEEDSPSARIGEADETSRASKSQASGSARACVLAVAIAAVYAITDEFHQMFVPGRACDPADWLVDVVAASLAVAIAYAIARRRQNRADIES